MATVNFITFNQDHSCLAVGTSRGFRIYYTDPFSKCYESKDGDISLVEMLFSTSLVALILSPRRLQITNTKRASTICELTFPSSVLAVRLNRKRLVVVLEGEIYLYDISNMKLAHTIETSPNPQAICALSSSSESCYLAYPLPQKAMPTSFAPPSHAPPPSGAANAQFITPTTGDVLLFDALKQEAINVIPAHRSPLSCLALSADGKLLATASDKGTIIRVFSVPDAQKLFQFRRGTYPSRIYSMAFNATNTLLCVSSATDTVHIFRLSASPTQPPANRPDSPIERGRLRDSSPAIQSITSTNQDTSPTADSPSRKHNGSFGSIIRRSSQTIGKSFAQSVGGYLPAAVTEMWEPARDFAYCKIPKSALPQSPGPGGPQPILGGAPLRSVVAISSSSPQVMVVTSEGLFYVFNVDMEAGGEGVLCKQYSLLEEMGALGDE